MPELEVGSRGKGVQLGLALQRPSTSDVYTSYTNVRATLRRHQGREQRGTARWPLCEALPGSLWTRRGSDYYAAGPRPFEDICLKGVLTPLEYVHAENRGPRISAFLMEYPRRNFAASGSV